MKNLLTLCFFAFALLISSQDSFAQEKYKAIDEMVKIETKDLTKILGLDNDQAAMVARTLYAKEKAYVDLDENTAIDKKQYAETKAKVDMNFKSKMMQILTEEQFTAYSSYLGKKDKPKY